MALRSPWRGTGRTLAGLGEHLAQDSVFLAKEVDRVLLVQVRSAGESQDLELGGERGRFHGEGSLPRGDVSTGPQARSSGCTTREPGPWFELGRDQCGGGGSTHDRADSRRERHSGDVEAHSGGGCERQRDSRQR